MLLIMAALAVQATSSATDARSPAPVKEKKICRSETATGSIMGHSVCHTPAEWTAINHAEAARRDNFRDQATNPGLPSLSGRSGG